MYIKIVVKFKKSATKEFQTLTEDYGEETLSRSYVFEWHKMFSKSFVSVKDDETAVKSFLKGTHFTSVEEVQAKTENFLKGLLKTSFQNCYQFWQHRMQKCVNAEDMGYKSISTLEVSLEDFPFLPDPLQLRRNGLVRSVLRVITILVNGTLAHNSSPYNMLRMSMVWVDTDPSAPGSNWIRMSHALEKGSRIVNWRIRRSACSDIHLCASLPLRRAHGPS
ncbi:hypothetical protein TNCV_1518811 [Trichonephila clavipes]|nr:hypothetical protein TNCV_1518811 [Trichonephila clavipes]